MSRTATRATTVGLYKKLPQTTHYCELSPQCTDPTDVPCFVVLITDCILKKEKGQFVSTSRSYIAITDDINSPIQTADLQPKQINESIKMDSAYSGIDIDDNVAMSFVIESGHNTCIQAITSRDSIYCWGLCNNTNPKIANKVAEAIAEFCDDEEETSQ